LFASLYDGNQIIAFTVKKILWCVSTGRHNLDFVFFFQRIAIIIYYTYHFVITLAQKWLKEIEHRFEHPRLVDYMDRVRFHWYSILWTDKNKIMYSTYDYDMIVDQDKNDKILTYNDEVENRRNDFWCDLISVLE